MQTPFVVLFVVWCFGALLSLYALRGLRYGEPELWERLGRPTVFGSARSSLALVRFVWSSSIAEVRHFRLRVSLRTLRAVHVLVAGCLLWTVLDARNHAKPHRSGGTIGAPQR
jgi:hypothetical protein